MKTSRIIDDMRLICSSSTGMAGTRWDLVPGGFSSPTAAIIERHLSSRASQQSLRTLGRHLAAIARRAWFLRKTESVEWASQAMLTLPISDFQNIARYYQAYCQQQRGELHHSLLTLTAAAERAPSGYRERALLQLGAAHLRAGDLSASADYCIEAARAAREADFLVHVQALWYLAVVKSVDGDHRGSLHDLEQLSSVIRGIGGAYPVFYFDYLNSLAVELSAVGRNGEANQIISKLLALPIAERYPTWQETAEEIALNEARGVSSPLVFAVGMPGKKALPTDEGRRLNRSSDRAGIDTSADGPSPSITRDICTPDPAPTVSESARRLPPFNISLRIAVSTVEAAIARSAANLPTAFAPTSTGCLPRRPDEIPRGTRVRDRHMESVLVPGEYPRFPLPRSYP